MRRGFSYLSLGVILLAGAQWASVRLASAAFTPFVPLPAPQRASADFDADGRPDVAAIQAGGSRVWVTLSGSPDTTAFEVNATSIIASDIDHDGDLDLTVATPTNQILIWLNDGRGHFTQEQPFSAPTLSHETTVAGLWPEGPVSLGPTAPQVVGSRGRCETAVVGTQIRPPTVPVTFALNSFALPSPRAPPPAAALN
jgi:FG-GAP-like repeat